MQRLDKIGGVARAVEEIGIAEGDVLGAGGHLLADVGEHHVRLHHAERAAVHRHYGTVAAQVLAAARGLGVSGAAGRAVRHQLRVHAERRQSGAVGRKELLAIEAHQRGRAAGRPIYPFAYTVPAARLSR